jgi:hypothetical protein
MFQFGTSVGHLHHRPAVGVRHVESLDEGDQLDANPIDIDDLRSNFGDGADYPIELDDAAHRLDFTGDVQQLGAGFGNARVKAGGVDCYSATSVYPPDKLSGVGRRHPPKTCVARERRESQVGPFRLYEVL